MAAGTKRPRRPRRRPAPPRPPTPPNPLAAEAPPVNGTASDIAEIMAAAAAPRAVPTLLIDKPLRSGQQIYAQGDVVILDLGQLRRRGHRRRQHPYLRPAARRALAGVKGNPDARIFCTCLEPELISIAGIYRTAEQTLPADVLGKSAQVRLADEKLILEPLRLK